MDVLQTTRASGLKASSEQLAIGLVLVVIAVLACLAPIQSDTWWLLRAGQEIWRTHRVPLIDTYSSTAAGRFWPNHEWLTEVIFYVTYRAGGLPLLTGLCAVTIVGTWAGSWRLMRGAFDVRFVLFAGSLVACLSTWAVRPQVFSMAALVTVCALLLANRLKWLPLVFLAWANFHGAVALGLAAVGAVIAADIFKSRRIPWCLVGTMGVCLIATCLSPLGLKLWTFIPESMARSRADQLIEWMPPGFAPTTWPFWCIAAALPIMLAFRWRRADERTARLAMIALALLLLAVRTLRNVPVFLLIGVPAVSALLAGPSLPLRRTVRENVRANAGVLAGATLLAVVFIGLVWRRPPERQGWNPISTAAIAAVDACREPIYNTYNDGGILIWFAPSIRVFVDNRQDPYPMPVLAASHALEMDGNYDALFKQYGVNCAVVPPASLTARNLRRDAQWSERYADRGWSVFGRALDGSRQR